MSLCQKNHFNKESIHNVAILWGGGLGDLLVLRSFVQSLREKSDINIYLLTTASHLPGLLKEICPDVGLISISTRLKSLAHFIFKYRDKFDLVYLGPYPRWKTRILGNFIAGKALVWSQRHKNKTPFLIEQIQEDIREMGFSLPHLSQFPYGAIPWKELPLQGIHDRFIVIHAGSKERWQTTRWPFKKWKSLINQLLDDTDLSLYFVGARSEETMLSELISDIPTETRNRIELFVSRPLQEVYSLISCSNGVVCHNSGILHMATLQKKETVCITGSSAYHWRPPYPWVKNITSGRCNIACNQYRCPIPFYKARCIRDISVKEVMKAIKSHFIT